MNGTLLIEIQLNSKLNKIILFIILRMSIFKLVFNFPDWWTRSYVAWG